MSTERAVLGGRLDASPRTLGLAAGDLLIITLLIMIGVVEHNGIGYLERYPIAAFTTAVPFYVGWFLAAVVAGAYAADAITTPKRAAIAGGGAWVIAAAIGVLVRGTSLFSGGFDLVFLAVITGFGLLALVPWRLLAWFVAGRGPDPAPHSTPE